MKKVLVYVISIIVFTGCTPKMGKDIQIIPQGNIRLENSQTDILIGALTILSGSVPTRPIIIGTDVTLFNHWHSDIKLVELSYTLESNHQHELAHGLAKATRISPIIVASNSQKTIPLQIIIDPVKLTRHDWIDIMQTEQKIFLKGSAVVEVWGFEHRHDFDKDVTPYLKKVAKSMLPLAS